MTYGRSPAPLGGCLQPCRQHQFTHRRFLDDSIATTRVAPESAMPSVVVAFIGRLQRQVIMEKKSKYTDAELIDAYKKYGSQTDAGKALGVSQTTVYRALKRNGFLEPRYVKCAYCGKLFLAKQIRSSYCSRKCKDISLRLAKGIPCNPNAEPYHKICVVCGKPFDSFRDTAVTCSHECAVTYHWRPNNGSIRINTTEIWVNQKHGDSFEYVSHTRKYIRLR